MEFSQPKVLKAWSYPKQSKVKHFQKHSQFPTLELAGRPHFALKRRPDIYHQGHWPTTDLKTPELSFLATPPRRNQPPLNKSKRHLRRASLPSWLSFRSNYYHYYYYFGGNILSASFFSGADSIRDPIWWKAYGWEARSFLIEHPGTGQVNDSY